MLFHREYEISFLYSLVMGSAFHDGDCIYGRALGEEKVLYENVVQIFAVPQQRECFHQSVQNGLPLMTEQLGGSHENN